MTPQDLSALKAELRAELLEELRAEQDRKERCKTMFQALMKKKEPEMEWLLDDHAGLGNRKRYCNVRDAIGALLRAVYKVDYVAHLPVEHETEIEEFIDQVLELMKKYRVKALDDPARTTRNERALIAEMAAKGEHVTLHRP